MSAHLEHHSASIQALYISGLLKKSELDSVQEVFVQKLKTESPIKLLVVLEHFTGWEKNESWADTDFFFEHRDNFAAIAILGDNRWEAEALAFTGAGLRKGPVKYFPQTDMAAALVWLNEQ